MNPNISIIVTTHRRAGLLERALGSILKQAYQDFEIILCSDEGSYETRQVAMNMLRESDVFLSLPGIRGPSQTRNIGVSVARGRWVCFLDDDDSFDPGYLQSAAPCLINDACLYYFDYTKVSESRGQSFPVRLGDEVVDQSKQSAEYLYVGNFIPINSVLIPALVAKSFSFDHHLETHEDWEWLISLKSKANINFQHVPLLGPVVHIGEGESRNNPSAKAMIYGLDFLSIYRRWRAPDDQVRSSRKRVLNQLGIGVSEEFL